MSRWNDQRIQTHRLRWLLFAAALITLALTNLTAVAQQRIRFPSGTQFFPGTFPSTTGTTATPWSPVAPGLTAAVPSTPPISATPWTPVPGSAGTLGGQIQPFDPYSLPQFGSGGLAPPAFPAQPTIAPPSILPPAANTAPSLPASPIIQPPPLGGAAQVLPPRTVGPIYGNPIQRQPVFPNGLNFNGPTGRQQRLFQDTGALYTYLYGDNDDELEMHEVEVFTSAVFPNFLRTPYGIRITPGFAFHFLDGPNVPFIPAVPAGPGIAPQPARPAGAQLPGQLYSAYVNALWQPQIRPQFGADINVRVGVYSDFDSVTSDSIRITGRGLGIVQLTPNSALKLGVEYLDRLDVKLLPAVGILYEPNPQTRWDIYFPRPKFSKYLTTRGNTEWWWHLGAEYGGGNWTIDRLNAPNLGMSERVDINDIRVFIGVDWNQLSRFDGIAEVGYVFDREVVVDSQPSESVDLDDTVMFRMGLKF